MSTLLLSRACRITAGTLLLTGLFAGCAQTPADNGRKTGVDFDGFQALCHKRLKGELTSRTELFFGLSKPEGSAVNSEEFQHFIDNEVTPRFPDGLTLLAGSGQFKDVRGSLIKEEAMLLILLYPFNEANNVKIEKIRTAYKSAFRQQSVLRIDDMPCGSF